MVQGPTPRPTPSWRQWQPIDQLPVIADVIDGMVASAEEQYPLLEEARPRPHMRDDDTVSRVVEVYTARRDDLWLCEEHLWEWRARRLTEAQRWEVERLTGQLDRLRALIDKIFLLMDDLKGETGETGETLMAKSHVQVARELLMRQAREQDR